MLLNVRIGKEEEEIVKGLRRAKVNISALLRRAIRDAAPKASKEKSPLERLKAVLDRYPPSKNEKASGVDFTSRKSMSAAILKHLKSK
jgi:hypothetical protein